MRFGIDSYPVSVFHRTRYVGRKVFKPLKVGGHGNAAQKANKLTASFYGNGVGIDYNVRRARESYARGVHRVGKVRRVVAVDISAALFITF